ncbi:MAG: hypothetical protein QG599_1037 [Pseudomonadota bacterium]|nr:hypothetical protein [Pseudomonadota bacterium]
MSYSDSEQVVESLRRTTPALMRHPSLSKEGIFHNWRRTSI